MARTTNCFLYMIGQGPEGIHGRMTVKIGIAADIDHRVSQLQIGNPFELEVLASWCFGSKDKARQMERELHAGLAKSRIRGEWFHVNPVGVMCDVDELLGVG